MAVAVKICGINSGAALAAALAAGADMIGLVFYPRSPRYVTPAQAGELAAAAKGRAERVGVVVDPDDALLEAILAAAPLDLLQLHGDETPARLNEIRRRFGVAVMKAIRIAAAGDLAQAELYRGAADRLMFDGKAPTSLKGAMPGGNRVSFDWAMLKGREVGSPWILSGGLDPDNVGQAIRASGARAVDVSSGVEDAPGHKDPHRIAAFLAAAKQEGKATPSWLAPGKA
jgi:phosphoribosylanthranilate isomerase